MFFQKILSGVSGKGKEKEFHFGNINGAVAIHAIFYDKATFER